MSFALLIVLLVIVAVLALLMATKAPADAVLAGALTVLMALPVPDGDGWRMGVISLAEGLSGFSNDGMLTVAVLYVVVAGLRETGAIGLIASRVLGQPRTERGAIVRVVVPICGMSVFLNNTPIVAMMIPAVQEWARRIRVSPSRLLIPLSYATILGGTCSLIGTSTNLVVAGLVVSQTSLQPLGMFDITWVGVPSALVGMAFLILAAPRLLPARRAATASLTEAREYALELVVPHGSPLAGATIEKAGLRSLPGCFLVEIERDGEILSAVGPEQGLRAGDRLLFVGVVESIRELVASRGLALATDQVFKLDSPRFRRRLFEAVVSPTSPLVGKTIREGRFRNLYNGAVIAVARNGTRLSGKLGDVRLREGDLLLVEAAPDFAARMGQSQDFLLVSALDDSTPRRHERAPLAIAILLGMVLLATFDIYPMLVAALLAAGAMLLTGCCTMTDARRSIDWSVLIVIGAALGIGKAMDRSGAAGLIADGVLSAAGTHPWVALAAIYVVTSILTEFLSNSAAVALVFPVAAAIAKLLGVDLMPFVIAIMMAGSASFATPIGYQTNLMVYGPGGYTFGDFLRIGVPMNILLGIVAVGVTPLVFPF